MAAIVPEPLDGLIGELVGGQAVLVYYGVEGQQGS